MKHPESWPELQQSPQIKPVAASRLLRPDAADTFQYLEEGEEYLAVAGNLPYGALSDRAYSDPESLHLLPAVHKAKEFVAFAVSEELLSLRALTLGTVANNRNVALLKPVYEQVGHVIGKVASKTHCALPLVTLDDIGFDRKARQPVLLPPLEFGESQHTMTDYADTFTGSIRSSLTNIWSPASAAEIADDFTKGMGHDISRQQR